MSRFLTRIELLGADRNDYESLHHYMEQAGFIRMVTGTNGTRSHLPPGEYRYEGSDNINTVRDVAKTAAETTGHRVRVLVAQYSSLSWINLEKS